MYVKPSIVNEKKITCWLKQFLLQTETTKYSSRGLAAYTPTRHGVRIVCSPPPPRKKERKNYQIWINQIVNTITYVMSIDLLQVLSRIHICKTCAYLFLSFCASVKHATCKHNHTEVFQCSEALKKHNHQ